eukprot:g13085.t1
MFATKLVALMGQLLLVDASSLVERCLVKFRRVPREMIAEDVDRYLDFVRDGPYAARADNDGESIEVTDRGLLACPAFARQMVQWTVLEQQEKEREVKEVEKRLGNEFPYVEQQILRDMIAQAAEGHEDPDPETLFAFVRAAVVETFGAHGQDEVAGRLREAAREAAPATFVGEDWRAVLKEAKRQGKLITSGEYTEKVKRAMCWFLDIAYETLPEKDEKPCDLESLERAKKKKEAVLAELPQKRKSASFRWHPDGAKLCRSAVEDRPTVRNNDEDEGMKPQAFSEMFKNITRAEEELKRYLNQW